MQDFTCFVIPADFIVLIIPAICLMLALIWKYIDEIMASKVKVSNISSYPEKKCDMLTSDLKTSMIMLLTLRRIRSYSDIEDVSYIDLLDNDLYLDEYTTEATDSNIPFCEIKRQFEFDQTRKKILDLLMPINERSNLPSIDHAKKDNHYCDTAIDTIQTIQIPER